jgi:hypothetical protein
MLLELIELLTKKVNWRAFLGLALFPLAAWLVIAGLWIGGMSHGKHIVQAQWDKERAEYQAKIEALQVDIKNKEAVHRQETAQINGKLRKTEEDHETTVAALRRDLTLRLSVSDRRASVYQRLAEAGPAQCRGLASHTAELDRSLEEGVGLVGELQARLGQREDQLRLVGDQLIADRKLVGTK